MLRTACPNISIITNFGCRANCWYCIWKDHPLQHVNPPTDWQRLYRFLRVYRSKGKVSVSGGGDSLYNYDKHCAWWSRLFVMANNLGMLIDVHTREKFAGEKFWKGINRCVFSSDKLKDDKDFLIYISNITKIRITHLVTADTTFEIIEEYLDFQRKTRCQFTIKELVKYDDNGMYKIIRQKYPNIYHLDKGDYNIYYMPDNTIRKSFL